MNIYQRLIENPLFFKWIYHTSPELEDYWERYMQLNPDEARFIEEFKKQFDELRYREIELSILEKKDLAKKILKELDLIDKRRKRIVFIKSLSRYAAISILFFSIGGGLVYQLMKSDQRDYFSQQISVPNMTQKPVLILNNKDKINLEEKESVLDYSKKDTILVNRQQVIKTDDTDEETVMNQLIIPYGNHSKVHLSDGTVVWLNAGSRLVYPSRFGKNIRKVYLIGEAFFHVHKNPEKPFVVRVGGQDVKVLGTKFDVSAYAEDDIVQTVLEEGSVSLHTDGTGFFTKDLILKPNQMAVFDKNSRQTKVQAVIAKKYTSWTQGLLTFQQADLNRVTKKLERYYNIHINFKNPLQGVIQVSGKLDLGQGRDEAFKYLEQAARVKIVKLNERNYEVK